MTDRPGMFGRFFCTRSPPRLPPRLFSLVIRLRANWAAVRQSVQARLRSPCTNCPHQVRDDGAIAPLYHCLRHCHPRLRLLGCRLGGRHDGAVAPFVLSPPLETLRAASLQCTVCIVIAAVPQGDKKTGSVVVSLPAVGMSGRPRLAECGSELVFKRFAQLVHDGVDLLVGKRLLRVLEYEADGV